MFKSKFAYTMMELVITLVIAGILAGIGTVGYYRARERALLRQAKVDLKMLITAEKDYGMKYGSYITCSSSSDCNSKLGLKLYDASDFAADNIYWAYEVLSGPLARARRLSGSYTNCRYHMGLNDTDPVYNSGSCP